MKIEAQSQGIFEIDVYRDGKFLESFEFGNLLTREGVDHRNSVTFMGGAANTLWYIGLFEGNYTPTDAATAATIAALSTEATAYSSPTRVTWTPTLDSVNMEIHNTASPAEFTLTADKLLYGAFLISSNVKGGTAGVLMSVARFSAPRQYYNTDVFNIKYRLKNINA